MFALSILVSVIIFTLSLIYIVFQSNRKSATHQWFSVFGFSIIFWSIVMYLSINFTDPYITLFLIRLSMLLGTVLAVSGLIFTYTFPGEKLKLPLAIKFDLVFLTPITMLVAMSPYMFTGVQTDGANIEPIVGPGIILFMITAIGSNISTGIILFYRFLKSSGIQRTRAFFMLSGIALMFLLLIVTNFFTVVVLHDSSFIFLAPVYPLLFLVSTAYALFRHQLFDIRFFLVRAVSYFVTVLVLASAFAAILFVFTSIFLGTSFSNTEIVVFVFLSLVFALLFQPIKQIFERITEKVFYRREYDTADILSELSSVVASTIVFSELINKVGDIFTSKVKVSTFWVVLYENDDYSGLFHDVRYLLPENMERSDLQNFIKNIFEKKTGLVFQGQEENESIKQGMEHLEVSVILPLIVNQKIIGGYLVGPKSTGNEYSQQDLDVMEISAPQLATGIQNALSYEEIKRFNITLQEKVNAATGQLRVTNSQLKSSNEKLQELDKLKDEFVSIASHELRTPLTAIKGYLWLALHKSSSPLPEEVSKNLQIAHEASERLSGLVEDMLTSSRIESGRIKFELAPYNIVKLASDVRDELKVRADEKKISLTLETALSNLEITGDKDRIREVMINLIGNALKFTPEGGEITLLLSQTTDKVLFEVKDTGPGLSKEDIDKLFQKFSKLDHSYANTKETGTGLGLYISKQIVLLHQGIIMIESEVGKGTSFIVKLPLVSHEEKPNNETKANTTQ